MSKGNIVVGVAWIIAIAAYISVLFYVYAPSAFAEWLATLLATFIGAVLAVVGGILLFNIQRRQSDDDRRNQLVTAFASEIRFSQSILSGRRTPIKDSQSDEEYGEVVLVPLPSVVVEEAARSALFDSKNTDNFFSLAGHIQTHNNEVNFFLAVRTGFATGKALQYAAEELQQRQEDLREAYKEWEKLIID